MACPCRKSRAAWFGSESFASGSVGAVRGFVSFTPERLLEGFASHAVFVGSPIALAIRRFSNRAARP